MEEDTGFRSTKHTGKNHPYLGRFRPVSDFLGCDLQRQVTWANNNVFGSANIIRKIFICFVKSLFLSGYVCVHMCAAWMLRRAEENARPLVLELQVVVSAGNPTWVLWRVASSIHYQAITILLVDCFRGLSREIGGGLFCLHTRVGCGGSIPVCLEASGKM